MSHPPAPHGHPHDWAQTLRNRGLRATVQRMAVLEFLQHHSHADAESIFQGLRSQLPTLSPQAIHLIVQDLSKRGLIRRISLPDSASARYETRIEDNHHHLQCVECGRIEDVNCLVGGAPCLQPSENHGMHILEVSIVFRGICQDCQAQEQAKESKECNVN